MKKEKQSYTCHSLPEYNIAMKLRKELGWGEYKIQRELRKNEFEIKLRTIISWIREGKKPFNFRILAQIPKSSKVLTKEKAYVLGTLCGDGYITTGYRVGLDVCDEDFAQYFKKCLEKIYNLTSSLRFVISKKANHKPKYCIMLVSKLVVLDLLSYLNSFKTFEWEVPDQIKNAKKKVQSMFIKGFADSEGCVKNRHRNREIMLASGNPKGLQQIKELLINFAISSYIVQRKNNVVNLYISDYRSLKIFYDNIGFVIQRKQEKLKAGLDRYKRKGIRKYSEDFRQKALALLKQGKTHYEIGKIMGTSYANIYDWEKAAKNPNYYRMKWQKQKN